MNKHTRKSIMHKTALIAGLALLVSGCAVTPEPISDDERLARANADLEAMFADQEALTGPVSLSEAMARAVKYNLDHRVKLLEEAVVRAEHRVARMDMLPDIAAQAGYTKRSNVAASSSESVITGRESLEPSTSQDRGRDLADATVVWNVLDFGVAYVTAKQRGDRILIAEEKRRKAVQNIIQDVRVAYWQALSASRLEKETDELLEKTRSALDRSRQMQEQGLQPPMDAMQYQEGLLSTQRSLWQLRQNLVTSRTELASLMNVRPGDSFELEPTADELSAPGVNIPLNELEEFALLHRPELIEEDLRVRISNTEIKKEMMRMLPGIEIDLGAHYDSNSYLVNNDWGQAGIRITWNLFNLISGPARKDRAEAQLEVDETRRMATAMAVLTQTNVAYQRYLLAKKDLELANVLLGVKNDIANEERARRQANVSDELREIRARLDALVARLQRDQALAEMQNAVGRIHNSVGLDPLPKEVTSHEVAELTTAIADHQATLSKILVQPQLDPSLYDAKAAEVLAERRYREAKAAHEKALADKQAAEEAAAKAMMEETERARVAEQSAAQAKNAQQDVIAAALAEAEAKRKMEEEAARIAAEVAAAQAAAEAKAAELEAARKAAQMAQEAADAAAAAEQAAREAAEKAEQERQAEAARIAAEVQAKLDAAVQAALEAGADKKAADDASSEVKSATEKLESIQVPEVPEKPQSLEHKEQVIEGSKQSAVEPPLQPAPAPQPEAAPAAPANPGGLAAIDASGWLYGSQPYVQGYERMLRTEPEAATVTPPLKPVPAGDGSETVATIEEAGTAAQSPDAISAAGELSPWEGWDISVSGTEFDGNAPLAPLAEEPAQPAVAPGPDPAAVVDQAADEALPVAEPEPQSALSDTVTADADDARQNDDIGALPDPQGVLPTQVTDMDPFNNQPLFTQ